jgi:F-type H+/Na+-transporting ATPase subunit alpha
VAGGLRLDLAAFRELEAFAQLGTELDRRRRRRLDRGYRMVELLKQPQYQPMNVIDQVLSDLRRHARLPGRRAVNRVREWEKKFLSSCTTNKRSSLCRGVREAGSDREIATQMIRHQPVQSSTFKSQKPQPAV